MAHIRELLDTKNFGCKKVDVAMWCQMHLCYQINNRPENAEYSRLISIIINIRLNRCLPKIHSKETQLTKTCKTHSKTLEHCTLNELPLSQTPLRELSIQICLHIWPHHLFDTIFFTIDSQISKIIHFSLTSFVCIAHGITLKSGLNSICNKIYVLCNLSYSLIFFFNTNW